MAKYRASQLLKYLGSFRQYLSNLDILALLILGLFVGRLGVLKDEGARQRFASGGTSGPDQHSLRDIRERGDSIWVGFWAGGPDGPFYRANDCAVSLPGAGPCQRTVDPALSLWSIRVVLADDDLRQTTTDIKKDCPDMLAPTGVE